KEKKKHIVESSADFSDKFKQLKRISNFSKILDSGLVDFLNEKFPPEAISVIGSYSRGEDIKDSDIDIIIISKKEYYSVSLINFEKKLNRKIHLIITYYDKMSNEFYTNLINGIVLYGYLNKK
ncbi:MAG: nucleotidyltransferase domain-containing protein, partial [Nanoarchaeota archaeon]|nr:nucleotidyltransferase domain-containing protein [Nanoarchaeota archaeon]